MPDLEQSRSAILIVNKSEEETRLMTQGLPMQVIQADHLEGARNEMMNRSLGGIFIDIDSAGLSDIHDIKMRSVEHNVPVFVLAHASEVPIAIQYVRHGAQGFLVKGLSDSDSLLKLMEYATIQS